MHLWITISFTIFLRNNNLSATIKIDHLSKFFDHIRAVNDLSLELFSGEIVALLGPNGAGKSTLINMIVGYLTPTAGHISILNHNHASSPLKAKGCLGFLPEGSPLYTDMNVRHFLHYMTKLKSLPPTETDRVIELANLKNVAFQKIETLSKGYKRRVGFAASMLGNPPILLLDEPTDGLDPNQKEHMLKLISSMRKEKTILISTHLLEEAKSVADRILIMDKGEIKADGSFDAILKQTRCFSLEKAFSKLTKANQ